MDMALKNVLRVLTVFAILATLGTLSAEGKPAEPFLDIPDIPDISDGERIEQYKDNVNKGSKLRAFLSYRRSTSRNLAMLVKVLMERENVSVFLDVEDLRGGPWDRQLVKAIDDSPNFIMFLAKGALDRSRNDVNLTDVVHREIRQAVEKDKRIVLVFDDYDFPPATDFSPQIQTALQSQGVTWQHTLVDQSLERILSFMI